MTSENGIPIPYDNNLVFLNNNINSSSLEQTNTINNLEEIRIEKRIDLIDEKKDITEYYNTYKNEFHLRTRLSRISRHPPKVFLSPFQIFKKNINLPKQKWNDISEDEVKSFNLKSENDILRFDDEWKNYLDKYIDIIFGKKKTVEEKKNILRNLLNLREKYGRKYVFKEVSKLISIMIIFKSNEKKSLFRKQVKKKKKFVFVLKKIKKRPMNENN
jgi:hypothetical protein